MDPPCISDLLQAQGQRLKGGRPASPPAGEYCSSVTPGQGRLVLCAKAHEDKLSTACISAINRAGYWVDSLASAIIYVGSQCINDAVELCPDVELGELRVLKCLEDQANSLSKYCGLAIKDVSRK